MAKSSALGPESVITQRIASLDWNRISKDLDTHGCAVLSRILKTEECLSIAALYSDPERFRSRVVMARHGFGRGEYQYFAYPLPDLVTELRKGLYPPLAELANRWNAASV